MGSYDKAFFDFWYQKENPWGISGEDCYEMVKKFLPDISDGLIGVEVGSGEGVISTFLKNHFKKLYCVEISGVAYKRALKFLEKESDKIVCINSDFLAADLPLADYIIGKDVFYYCDPLLIQKKLKEITKIGSYILIIEIHKGAPYNTAPRMPPDFGKEEFLDGRGWGIWKFKRIK